MRNVFLASLLPAAMAYQIPGLHRGAAALMRSPMRTGGIALQMMPGQEPQIKADETYNIMLTTLLQTNESLTAQISANYAMVDYAFLQRLQSELDTPNQPADKMERLQAIKEATNAEMASRMQTASVTLRDILTSPTPVIMEGKITGLVRQGKIDLALMDLLQANLEQAQAAGEAGANAVRAMSGLKARVQSELDVKLPPAPKLLRRLLRMDDKDARVNLLKEKMRPKAVSKVVIASAEGKEQEQSDPKPDVPPREFAEAIKEIKMRFGNVDENYDTGFVKKLETIAEEAEAVALELAGGKELSSRQQQDMMWDRGSVSVWDLEQVEEEAHQDGNYAMWEPEAQEIIENQERREAAQRDFGQMG